MREREFAIIRALISVMGVALCFTKLFCSHRDEIVFYDLCRLRDFASHKEQALWIDFGSPRFRKHLIKNWGDDE